MLDNAEIRKSWVSWLLGNSTITDTLSDAEEIRERDWQGEDFTYPNIRITCSSKPTECEFSDTEATISYFSELKSSRQSIESQGIIAKQVHKKNFISENVQMSSIIVTDLPDAFRSENGVWQTDVVISAKASSA